MITLPYLGFSLDQSSLIFYPATQPIEIKESQIIDELSKLLENALFLSPLVRLACNIELALNYQALEMYKDARNHTAKAFTDLRYLDFTPTAEINNITLPQLINRLYDLGSLYNLTPEMLDYNYSIFNLEKELEAAGDDVFQKMSLSIALGIQNNLLGFTYLETNLKTAYGYFSDSLHYLNNGLYYAYFSSILNQGDVENSTIILKTLLNDISQTHNFLRILKNVTSPERADYANEDLPMLWERKIIEEKVNLIRNPENGL